MKNKIILILVFILLALPGVIFAANHEYKLLEPLPGLSETVTLSSYLSWLFPFVLTVAAFLAVLMIVIGGVVYMTGGSEGSKTKGREMIWQAIIGLLLALSAYILLNTINPDLVNMKLGIPDIEIQGSTSSGSGSSGAGTPSPSLNANWLTISSINPDCPSLGDSFTLIPVSYCGPMPALSYGETAICCGTPIPSP